jgi:hypothetical protein
MDISARLGRVLVARIFTRLIETPTNINPVRAAAAPAAEIKNRSILPY